MQNCSNYRGINLMSHIIKIRERVSLATLREKIMTDKSCWKVNEQQCGFVLRKSSTNTMFALRVLMQMCRKGQELH